MEFFGAFRFFAEPRTDTRVCFIPKGQKDHLYILSYAQKHCDWYRCMCV